MSHQSGIEGGEALTQAFAEFYNSDSTRMIKVVIENEQLVPKEIIPANGSDEEDWDNSVLNNVEEKEPCYLIYRLDSKNSNGYDFVFIAWSPDFAHIRSKMLYASTRATLKTAFGSAYITQEMFGTVEVDVSLNGYHKHLQSESAPPPLTNEEIEKKEIRQMETGAEIGASTKRAIATGVQFPLDAAAEAKLNEVKAGKISYVQLKLDIQREVIELERAENCTVHDIAGFTPDASPRYHVFLFHHNHEGDTLNSYVFVYSCPGYKCPVKERMLYSTCKGPLLDELEGDKGFVFAKHLEIGEASEFTHDWLFDQLHPAKTVYKTKFDRPKKPGKGGRRLMRSSQDDGEKEKGSDEDFF